MGLGGSMIAGWGFVKRSFCRRRKIVGLKGDLVDGGRVRGCHIVRDIVKNGGYCAPHFAPIRHLA